MCNICLSFLLIAIAVRGRFPQTRDLWKRASMDYRVGRVSSHATRGTCFVTRRAWDVFRRTPSRGSRGRRAAVDFVWCV